MSDIRIRIFYPADPLGVVPGGIDTFLRGIIKWAPGDLSFSLVGMTTDAQSRPLGRWTRCRIGARDFDMHPVCAVADAGARGRVPLSVKYMAGLNRDRLALATDFDVFDFHRVEPALMWSQDQRPKNHFFHQDPNFVRLSASDNLWRHMPSVYDRIERSAMQEATSAWCVRDSGTKTLRLRYPKLAERIRFVPTWVDVENFHPVAHDERLALREQLAREHAVPLTGEWIVTVGRLDTQKDPALMAESFARLVNAGRDAHWLVVGDGVLRAALQRLVADAGVGARVHFLGLQAPSRIARILQCADLYALSSAYEGMPMALLEALGSGLPVVSTDVGEVRRVLQDGVNGRLLAVRDADSFSQALGQALDHRRAWGGSAAQAAIAGYQPQHVLTPVFENYREIGSLPAKVRALRQTRQASAEGRAEPRTRVVGIPVNALSRAVVTERLLGWAKAAESRVACFVNVHSVVQATLDQRHRWVLEGADLLAPDGAPVAWTLRAKGHADQDRVDGPTTMWRLCEVAQARGVPIGLYGSSTATLEQLCLRLREAFPGIDLAYVHSPPFRDLTAEEDQAVCDAVVRSGVRLLFVGLGCPKQEYWMAAHRGRIPAVMLGVGAAFEFHAGVVSRAPQWMRDHGFEWLHRLSSQPGRLWRRYAYTNSLFLAKSAGEAARALVGRLRAPQR